jgi:hypothetical protein
MQLETPDVPVGMGYFCDLRGLWWKSLDIGFELFLLGVDFAWENV